MIIINNKTISFMQKKCLMRELEKKYITPNRAQMPQIKSTVEYGLYPFEHSLAALARAQMGTTQTHIGR